MPADQIHELAIERLKAAPQIRKEFDSQMIGAIAKSLLVCGQLQPIRVRRTADDFLILDGEMRYRAALIAKLPTMQVIIEQNPLSEGEVIHRQLVSNCQRSDLNDIEKAMAVESLMKASGWNITQAAANLGLSVGAVSKSLSLLTLPAPLQQQVRDGRLPATAAYTLTQVQESSIQAELAARVSSGELTRDGLSKAVKAKAPGQRRPRKPRPKCVTARLANSRSVSVRAASLDLNSFVLILEEMLTHARQGRSEGLTLEVLLKRLAEQRAATSATT